MINYIESQPAILQKALDNQDTFVKPFYDIFQNNHIKRIVLFGSGTSYHVASIAAMYFNKYLPVYATSHFPIPFVDCEKIDPAHMYKPNEILTIGISQTGTSSSTIQAMNYAKQQGCISLCYSQAKDSSLAKICDTFVPIPCLEELVPPETQGYTAALLGMYISILHISNHMEKMQAVQDMIHTHLQKAIDISKQWIHNNHHELIQAHKIYICGNNLNYITAQEGAIKVGETWRRVTKPQEIEEFAHFADLAMENDDNVFMIDHTGFRHERTQAVLSMIAPITKHVFTVTNAKSDNPKDCVFDFPIEDDLSVFYYVIPFQLLAATVSEWLGIDTSIYPYKEVVNIAHDDTYLLYKIK